MDKKSFLEQAKAAADKAKKLTSEVVELSTKKAEELGLDAEKVESLKTEARSKLSDAGRIGKEAAKVVKEKAVRLKEEAPEKEVVQEKLSALAAKANVMGREAVTFAKGKYDEFSDNRKEKVDKGDDESSKDDKTK